MPIRRREMGNPEKALEEEQRYTGAARTFLCFVGLEVSVCNNA
jgi:hypothetical protein